MQKKSYTLLQFTNVFIIDSCILVKFEQLKRNKKNPPKILLFSDPHVYITESSLQNCVIGLGIFGTVTFILLLFLCVLFRKNILFKCKKHVKCSKHQDLIELRYVPQICLKNIDSDETLYDINVEGSRNIRSRIDKQD